MQNTDNAKLPLPETWHNRILKAAGYAASGFDHPLYRLGAKEGRISAYSLAFLDCLDGPQLLSVDSSRWTGGIGQTIHFHLKETIRIMQVRVMVRAGKTSKTVLESGHAYPSRLNPMVWTYITKTDIRQTPGLCMDILANDLAGNFGADLVVFDYE
ncbi:MAG: hypothetical protein ACM3XO_02680 [Bacteroidota bacterium]